MTQALESGTGSVRRRALFGLLDADGWGWASVKAAVWLIIIIVMLGYIPDRAYYIVVNRTIDVGLLAWSPVNLCPSDDKQGDLPCPAPAGAVLPWQPSPSALALPAPRTAGNLVQLGGRILYIGGSDGAEPVSTVYVADLIAGGSYTAWQAGPQLPEARQGASVVVSGGKVHLFGGTGPNGVSAASWVLDVDPETGELGAWAPDVALNLPAPRTGAAIASLADGLLVVGGSDADGMPTQTTWKSTIDSKGALGEWSEQAPIQRAVSGATAVQVGDYIWLVGGNDASGPSGAVQRGTLGTGLEPPPPGTYINPSEPPAPVKLLQWAISNEQNLPGARSDAAVFTANGSIYVVGGSDAEGLHSQLWWAVPDGDGEIPEWRQLAATDLPGGLRGGAPLVNGAFAFIVGGATADGVLAMSTRANLAPQEPFFQLGLVGATIPALRIEGELGQQLGMLSAAGAGTTNFVILLLLGWAWPHRGRARAWLERRRKARRREVIQA